MRTLYKNFSIELFDNTDHTIHSKNAVSRYKHKYCENSLYDDAHYPTSKHGIIVSKNGKEISSAILCEVGGATTVHEHSFAVAHDTIFMCCGDKVYSLGLPFLELQWIQQLDTATCFGIYTFNDDFIIHGELQISRINQRGEVQWSFGARDIFVLQDGSKAISIDNNRIYLKDWEGYEYILDSNGNEIQ